MGTKLTRRERLNRIFRNKEVDRPALKLWGASSDPYLLHDAYKPVRELAYETTDLFGWSGSSFDIFFGKRRGEFVSQSDSNIKGTQWFDRTVTWRTPRGELRSVERCSRAGEPSYVIENFVKTPEDLEKILSIPYEPFPFDASQYFSADESIGDAGIAMFGLDHAGYAIHRLAGSETLAYMSADCRGLLNELLKILSGRLLDHVREALAAGIRGVFAWVGPEVFIPPLMSPADFEEFVFGYDKPLCDEIKNGGGCIWVHCHGKVSKLIGRFAEMGVDVLNPLEPETNKNGDVDLLAAAKEFKNKIGLEGNIENQTLIFSDESEIIRETERIAEALKLSGRGVMCPSSGYMEIPSPTEKYISNLLTYLKSGLDALNK